MPVVIRPYTDDDLDAAHTLSMRAFSSRPGTPRDPDRPLVPTDRRLVAELDGRVVGHLGAWELGQWFAGRRVPVAGIAGVTVAPEVRGRGVGSALVRAGLEAAVARGEPVATLYPLTRAVYRAHGFELAGTHPAATVTSAALARLPRPSADVRVLPGGPEDLEEMTALEREVAAATGAGALDRSPPFAARVLRPGDHHRVVLVRREDVLVGYAVYEHVEPAPGDTTSFFRLDVDELVGRDADALLALYRTLGSHASGATFVRLLVAPEDPLDLLLPERAWRDHETVWRWMSRLVDPPAAIVARGWPDHVRVRVELDLADPVWPERGGAWTLEVDGGEAALSPGGRGTVALDAGAMASWFTGYQSATRLASVGRVRTSDRSALLDLDAATAGPTPWARSFF